MTPLIRTRATPQSPAMVMVTCLSFLCSLDACKTAPGSSELDGNMPSRPKISAASESPATAPLAFSCKRYENPDVLIRAERQGDGRYRLEFATNGGKFFPAVLQGPWTGRPLIKDVAPRYLEASPEAEAHTQFDAGSVMLQVFPPAGSTSFYKSIIVLPKAVNGLDRSMIRCDEESKLSTRLPALGETLKITGETAKGATVKVDLLDTCGEGASALSLASPTGLPKGAVILHAPVVNARDELVGYVAQYEPSARIKVEIATIHGAKVAQQLKQRSHVGSWQPHPYAKETTCPVFRDWVCHKLVPLTTTDSARAKECDAAKPKVIEE